MSLGARATKGGAKGKEKHAPEKGKTDKPQPKEKVKPQATTEQLRMANMIDRKSEDASDVRKMVLELMEMTCRTEEEVCSALHDCDNDMVLACNLLLEDTQRIQSEWQTREKKKKKPPAATGNGSTSPGRSRERSGARGDRERPRRDRDENAARPRGARGGRGGRGGGRGGARGGRRGAPHRDRPAPHWDHNQDSGGNMGDSFPATEDWDNEEWSGSLSDTKVFTPSSSTQPVIPDSDPAHTTEDWDAVETNGPTEGIPSFTYHNPLAPPAQPLPTAPHATQVPQPHAAVPQAHATVPQPQPQQAPPAQQSAIHYNKLMEQMSTANSHATGTVPGASSVAATGGSAPAPAPDTAPPDPYHSAHHHQPMGMSGSLTAAQSQYLSQLTQQSQRHDASVYSGGYGVYGAAETTQRKPQRARVPPPSKIPVSAVEMPGGEGGSMFLDVQFGALEPDHIPAVQSEPSPAPTPLEQPAESPVTYSNSNSNMLNESLTQVVDTTPPSQPVVTEPIVTNSTSSLEKQLTASMKQLTVQAEASATSVAPSVASGTPVTATPSVSATSVPTTQQQHSHHHQYSHRSSKTAVTTASAAGPAQAAVYAAHGTMAHHPHLYGASVYAPQQVNSTNASMTVPSAVAASAYPSSVTLTQYQPIMNSYQTSSSVGAYGGSALYTAAPYTPYQPPHPPKQTKDSQQYDNSVASSNSLTSTSTTQTAASKVTTTTVSSAAVSSASVTTGATVSNPAGQPPSVGPAPTTPGYAAGALYGAGTFAYDDQMMRSTLPHHMGGYYEVGYGVGVGVGGVGGVGTAGRDASFSLAAGDRFSRNDAASPQQVPAAALPPGYAYFYQPPPTTYQYGVYPTYGGGSNVTGVSGGAGGKLNTYAPQQPPYDAQDTYKQGGPYTGSGSKSGAGAADLSNAAMYAKTHVALNKVNSYEKAGFHSGTPPPFGASSHLYIPAPPHHHHHQQHHHQQQHHQMDVRVNSSHNRRESGSGGGRTSGAKPPASKPTYSQSYWAPN